jgi:hypothetical protein
MLIEIDPPLSDSKFGVEGSSIRELIISARLQGRTLYPMSALPFSVYVCRILDIEILTTCFLKTGQVELIAWANIYASFEEADAFAKQFTI